MQYPQRSCAELLKDEALLWKVLSYLDADDIAECRRVCRLWRRVSHQLPLKVKLYPNAESIHVASLFPGTKTLQLVSNEEEERDALPEIFFNDTMKLVRGLRNLKRFEANTVLKHNDWIEELRRLKNLEAIDIHSPGYKVGDIAPLVKDLVCLTELSMRVSSPSLPQEEASLAEGRGLKKLGINLGAAFCRNGRLRYPGLAQLTSLSFFLEDFVAQPRHFQELRLYSGTVKELSFSHGSTISVIPLAADSFLSAWSRLESLSIMTVMISGDQFFECLAELQSLKQLTLNQVCLQDEQRVGLEAVPRLMNLHSLTISELFYLDENGKEHSMNALDCSGLTRLTSLRNIDSSTFSQLPETECLKQVCLNIRWEEDHAFFVPLARHTRLERLELEVWCPISAVQLAPFIFLRHFTLWTMIDIQNLIPVIRSMVQLEYLSIPYFYRRDQLRLLSVLPDLCKLHTLKVDARWNEVEDLVNAPLRYLEIKHESEKQRSLEDFRQKIPTLKRVTYSR